MMKQDMRKWAYRRIRDYGQHPTPAWQRWAARLLVLGLLAMLVITVFRSANAQDADCETDELVTLLREQADAIEAGDLDGLADLQAAISQTRAECSGFAYEGDGNEVLGPVEFPDGFYRIETEMDTFGTVTLTEIDGNCGFVILGVFETNGGDDNAATELDGCEALIEISTTENWTLIFEQVD